MHAISIRSDLEFEKKYHIPTSITEIFSILFDRFSRNEIFTEKNNDFNLENLEKIIDFSNFMELFFIVFYSINPLTKINFWNKNHQLRILIRTILN